MVNTLYQNSKVPASTFFTFLDIYRNGKSGQDSAMTNAEIRRENARWLAKQCGGPSQFAEKLELSESRISQLIGKNPVKNIGTATARKIEEVCNKPEGWLDVPGAWAKEEAAANGTAVTLVNTADLVRLVSLFGQASETGRLQILRMAEGAEKAEEHLSSLRTARSTTNH